MDTDNKQLTEPHPLFAELGLEELSPEEQVETLASVGEVVFQGVMVRVMEELPDEKQDELSALFEASTQDSESEEKHNAIYEFIAREVPAYDTYVREELDALYDTYRGTLDELVHAAPNTPKATNPDTQSPPN